MNKKKVVELLKSGNFTIAYHDSSSAWLYEGKLKYEDLAEDGECYDFSSQGFDYISEEVELLVKALGGKVVSI